MIQKFEAFNYNTHNLYNEIQSSFDWIKMKETDDIVNGSSSNYLYTKSPKGYKYVISKRDNNLILYLFDDNLEFLGFIGYADSTINKYHERFCMQYGPLNGGIKYMDLNVKVLSFFKSLPDEEDIEDWFIYLEDSGFKINDIDTGFIDWSNESSIYSMIDVDSGPPSIVIKFDGLDIHGLELDDYKKSYHLDKKFRNNNPKFFKELKSCLNRSDYYLKDMSKNFIGHRIFITSWGLTLVALEFRIPGLLT